jgi:hypothetical protein
MAYETREEKGLTREQSQSLLECESNLLKKYFNAAPTLRLAIALMCTALFVMSVMHFQQNGWRENVVAFLNGLLAGYYYTSAWYARRPRQTRTQV